MRVVEVHVVCEIIALAFSGGSSPLGASRRAECDSECAIIMEAEIIAPMAEMFPRHRPKVDVLK